MVQWWHTSRSQVCSVTSTLIVYALVHLLATAHNTRRDLLADLESFEYLNARPEHSNQSSTSPSSTVQVHMIWVSNNLGKNDRLPVIPLEKLHSIDSWRSSRTSVTLWDDKRIRETFPEYVPMLERIPVSAWISDIVRYLIILRFGGVYLDADVLPVNNDLRDLLAQTQGNFTVCQTPWVEFPHSRQDECMSVINAILAAPAQSKATLCALTISMRNTRNELEKLWPKYTTDISGPPVWTHCSLIHNINILESWTFLPCPFSMHGCANIAPYMNLSGVYGMHEWDKSWW